MIDERQENWPRGEAVAGPPDRRGSGIGPEVVAAVLGLVVIVAVVGGVLAGGKLPGPGPGSIPSSSVAVGPPTRAPYVDQAVVTTLLEIDRRLAADRAALEAELAAAALEPSKVAAIFRSTNADVVAAIDIPARLLRSTPASAAVGAILTKFYTDLHDQISAALVNSVRNAPAYRAAGKAIVTTLGRLKELDAALRGLGSAPSPSTAPSASVGPVKSPPVTATPTSAPTASPAPSAAPTPSGGPGASASPTAGPPSANGLVNPGFEAGVGQPWELVLGLTGSATLHEDRTIHAGGSASARVDFVSAGDERAAVAVRQGGQAISAGSHYVGRIAVRSDTAREVRLRVASADGVTYGTRLFTVGPDWQVLTIDTTVFATDANAYLEIDLGRFPVTTWLDDASFGQVVATGG